MTKKINKPLVIIRPADEDMPPHARLHGSMTRKCPLAYSSASKNWWQQNSERIGGELNWDVFNEIWMAGYDDGHEEGYTAGHSDGRDSGFRTVSIKS